jgi:spore coat protein U-like protein
MMTLIKKLLVTCFAMSAVGYAHAQTNGTLAGQVGVQITIGAGCTITNGSIAGGVNNWGTINFGTHADLVNVIDAQTVGASGNIQILCSTGLTPTMTVNAGLHEDSGQRFMQNTTSSNSTIAYSLYSDAARSAVITPNQPVSLTTFATGNATDIPLYGRITPTGQTSTTPTAGAYSDTLLVTLAW